MAYHSYLFFDAISATAPVNDAERVGFEDAVRAHESAVHVQSYATLGMKVGTRFMLHAKAETPDAIQLMTRDLMHTPLGRKLRIVHTFLGMTAPSQYHPQHPPKEGAPEAPHRYLVVYPFTKTVEWHLLPFEERKNIMKAHVDVGRAFTATVAQLLLYSYGIDDQEFIVSYYTDKLDDFQKLVMEMRTTESRRHTKSDTPIFTCIHMPLREALSMV